MNSDVKYTALWERNAVRQVARILLCMELVQSLETPFN